MPQPTPGDLHVDRYLTDLSVSWSQDQANFVADKVFPVVPVRKASDKYAIYEKGFFYRDEMKPRPLGGEPQVAGYGVTSDTYSCVEEALAHNIDDRVRSNADQPLDPDRAAMRLLTTQALIHRDRLWAASYFKPGVWGTDLTGRSATPGAGEFLQWDQSGSDPISLIDEKRDDVVSGTGYEPKVLVMGRDVFRTAKNHADIIDRVKYTQRGVLTQELLASLLNVDKVVVPSGVANSAVEGQADSIDFIVGRKDMLLVYAAAAPSIDQPSGGYTFAWTDLIAGATNAFGGVIQRMRDERAHSDHFQIRTAYDMKAVSTELGVFFSGVVA